MGVRLRGTAVEPAAEAESVGVTDRPEILSDASRVILKSQAPRSAVTRTMAVGPVTWGAPAFFNLPAVVTSPRKKGVALSGGKACCIGASKLAWMAGKSSPL